MVVRPLYPSESAGVEGDGLPVVMLWMVLGCAWAATVFWRRDAKVRFGWSEAAMLGLVGWHAVAALAAVRHGSPRPAINMLWEWAAVAVGFFLARQVFVSRREIRCVTLVMVALAVALSSYGLYQYFYELPATRALYRQDPDEALRQAGLWFPPGSADREAFEQRLESVEPLATFALTNSLAGLLAPWLVMTLGMSVLVRKKGSGTFRAKHPEGLSGKRFLTAFSGLPLFSAGACLSIGSCLVLTKSRSAYLAALVGVCLLAGAWWLVAARRRGRVRRLVLTVVLAGGLVAGAIGGGLAVGGLDVQVLTEAPKSLGYRLEYWRSTWAMIGDHPWLGCGPGNFQAAYTQYKLPQSSEEISDPHNFLLEVWATAGTPALAALVAAVLLPLGFSFRGLLAGATGPDGAGDDGKRQTETCSGIGAVPAILLGGGLGFALAVPVGLMAAAPTAAVVLLWMALVAGIAVALGFGWVRDGRIEPWLPAVAAVTLAVDLLFAGGIGFPAVAGSFWLLLALALNCDAAQQARPIARPIAAATLLAALALAGACYLSAYAPVLRCRGALRRAISDPANAPRHLQAAAWADPWAAQPWEQLADLALNWGGGHPQHEDFRRFDHAVGMAMLRMPQSASSWNHFAHGYLKMYLETDRRDSAVLEKAVEAFRRAVILYPTNCRYHADLAEALLLAHDAEGFRRHRDEALRLDRLTPHADKRLDEEQRSRLRRSL